MSHFFYAKETGSTPFSSQYVRFTSRERRNMWVKERPGARMNVRAKDSALIRYLDPKSHGRIVAWTYEDGVSYMRVYPSPLAFQKGEAIQTV